MKGSLTALQAFILSDLYRYAGNRKRTAALRKYLSKPGFKLMCWLRITNYLKGKSRVFFPAYIIARLIHRRLTSRYTVWISYETNIGPGFHIPFLGSIVINKKTKIGADCTINPGVTIGAKNSGPYKGVPVIGNRVYIGSGAKILGAVTIGDDVLIGPNCVVTKDVPNKAVVVGIPGRVASYDGSFSYIKFASQPRKTQTQLASDASTYDRTI